jgi:DNA-binding MarR family transcriptional regulator
VSKHDDGQIGVVAALVRSSFLVNAVYAGSGREHGLTPQQGQLLCVLMARPYGMSELGAMLGLAKSSLTGLVDRTERNGLVQREPDPQDTRAVRVALTPRGSRLAAEFYAATCRRIEKLTTGLSAAGRDMLADLLGRIVLDNEVPVVFMELDEGTPAARQHGGP